MYRLLCLVALCVLGISRIKAAQAGSDLADQYADQDLFLEDKQQYDEFEGSASDYSGQEPYITDDEDAASEDGSADYGGDDKLTKCEKELKQNGMVGSGKLYPDCTATGEYAAKQCRATGECWCVNFKGQEIPGTFTRPPWTPQCDESDRTKEYPKLPIEKPKMDNSGNTGNSAPTDPSIDIDPIYNEVDKTDPKNTEVSVDNVDYLDANHDDDEDRHDGTKEQLSRDTGLLRQPLMLAGLIAIAVVCLLCAVLLVMFIVYRMRKKDEGSYALDEPKRSPSHPYQRAPTREFFA